MDFERSGQATVEVWATCSTANEIDLIIGWLQLAKSNFRQWEHINAKRDKAPKAPPKENAPHQQGKVLGAS